MTVTVRKARLDDIPSIQALAKVTLESHPLTQNSAARLLQRVYAEPSLKRSIESNGSTFLVADQNGQIIGMCHFGSPLMDGCEDRKEIHRLLVHPDCCRSGIGTALLASVEAALNKDAKVRRVSVYVLPEDRARLRFFGKHGYHHDQLEDTGEEWYMEKSL